MIESLIARATLTISSGSQKNPHVFKIIRAHGNIVRLGGSTRGIERGEIGKQLLLMLTVGLDGREVDEGDKRIYSQVVANFTFSNKHVTIGCQTEI